MISNSMWLMRLTLFCWLALGFCFAQAEPYTLNIMAPLTIGDIHHPHDEAQTAAWDEFRDQLLVAKSLGVEAVTTDLWWGLIEATEDHYNWEYYDKLVDHIEAAGLRWVPILSLHQLGGNVGDAGYVPIPSWIWTKYVGQGLIPDSDTLKFRSEQGRLNSEYVSFWATPVVLQDYRRLMMAFQSHFAPRRHLIQEINISLGPAGELRYPSYNSHDEGSGYGTRGALQAYSGLAVASFRDYVRTKYGSIEAVNQAWGFHLVDESQVMPPDPAHLKADFFARGQHLTPYGIDFFDWYNDSLTEHGRLVLQTAFEVFSESTSAFHGIDLGAKLPGIHWRMAIDRLAELHAGLIRSQDLNYQRTLNMFKAVESATPGAGLILHFTALELWDGREGPEIGSLAKTLVGWIGEHAKQLDLRVKGENALAEELSNLGAWDNILHAITELNYSGFTALRLGSVVNDPQSRAGMLRLSEAFQTLNCAQALDPR